MPDPHCSRDKLENIIMSDTHDPNALYPISAYTDMRNMNAFLLKIIIEMILHDPDIDTSEQYEALLQHQIEAGRWLHFMPVLTKKSHNDTLKKCEQAINLCAQAFGRSPVSFTGRYEDLNEQDAQFLDDTLPNSTDVIM